MSSITACPDRPLLMDWPLARATSAAVCVFGHCTSLTLIGEL